MTKNTPPRFSAPEPSYSLGELAKLIAAQIQPRGEPLRTTVDKVQKRLKYAIHSGELQVLDSGSQLLSTAQVLPWARKKWPEFFKGVPVRHEIDVQSGFRASASSDEDLLPGDLQQRREALMKAFQTISQLRQDLAKATEEAERLRPKAEKYEDTCLTNHENGKKGGRPKA